MPELLPNQQSAPPDSPSASLPGLPRLKAALAALPPEQFVAAFYINIEFHNQAEWLNALARACKKQGQFTIGILTSNSLGKCSLSDVDLLALIAPEEIASLDSVNIFLAADRDLATQFPRSAKVLCSAHAFYLRKEASSFPGVAHFAAKMDGWIMPMLLTPATRRKTADLWNNFIHPDASLRGTTPFCLIPGYPPLAAMADKLAVISAEPDAIVYAPYAIEDARRYQIDNVGAHGKKIIQTILETCPQQKVVFRPSPYDISHPVVQAITATFAGNDRFILDTSRDKILSFSLGRLLITDLSSIVRSFAFLTLRPAITFRPWEHGEKECSRSEEGFHATTYAGLKAALQLALANPQAESERIRTCRDKLVCSFAGYLDELASRLPAFCAGKVFPEWLAIERDKPSRPRDIIVKISRCKPHERYITAALAARWSVPEPDPLLTAWALHLGMISSPQTVLLHEVRQPATLLLNRELPKTYGAIPAGLTRKLYLMAFQEYRHDAKTEDMIARLLAQLAAGRPS